jgi:hypothetical protein
MSQWFHQGRFLSGWPDVQLGVEGRGGARGLQSPRVGQYHLGARHLRNRPFSTREIHGAAKSPGINIKSLKKGTDIYIIYISIYIYIYIHTYIHIIYIYILYIYRWLSICGLTRQWRILRHSQPNCTKAYGLLRGDSHLVGSSAICSLDELITHPPYYNHV